MLVACLAAQAAVVLFMALHDWVPLGALNNLPAIRVADSRARLFVTTLLSTLPFAIVLAGTAIVAAGGHAAWTRSAGLFVYASVLVGIARAWYVPYLVAPNAARAKRYAARFADTHAFLPERHGIRPDTLHVSFHVVAVATLALIFLTPMR